MLRSTIALLVSSYKGSRLGVCEFQNIVYIWDWKTGKRITTLYTVFDFGGRRVAITPKGDRCVIASWELGGVACYSVRSGEPVWARGDLKKTQRLTISPDGRQVFCGREDASAILLDVETGRTLENVRNADDLVFSNFAPLVLVEGRRRSKCEIRRADGSRVASIDRVTSGVLDAAFGPHHLVTSDMGGPVRCFETERGTEVWRYTPAKGIHRLHVCYSKRARQFFGIADLLHGRDHPRQLIQFEPASGEAKVVLELSGGSVTAFCGEGNFLVTSDGWVVDLVAGERVKTLRFPREHVVEPAPTRGPRRARGEQLLGLVAIQSAGSRKKLTRRADLLARLRADILASERPKNWFGPQPVTKESCAAALEFFERALKEIRGLPLPDEAGPTVGGGVVLRWYCQGKGDSEFGVFIESKQNSEFFCQPYDSDIDPTEVAGTWPRLLKHIRECARERRKWLRSR